MAQTLNYEVQFLEGWDWKIEAVYQDREAALEVAEELVNLPGFSKVRVVEETHDDDTGKTATRAVFVQSARQSDAPAAEVAPAPNSAPARAPHHQYPPAPVRPAPTMDDDGPGTLRNIHSSEPVGTAIPMAVIPMTRPRRVAISIVICRLAVQAAAGATPGAESRPTIHPIFISRSRGPRASRPPRRWSWVNPISYRRPFRYELI